MFRILFQTEIGFQKFTFDGFFILFLKKYANVYNIKLLPKFHDMENCMSGDKNVVLETKLYKI